MCEPCGATSHAPRTARSANTDPAATPRPTARAAAVDAGRPPACRRASPRRRARRSGARTRGTAGSGAGRSSSPAGPDAARRHGHSSKIEPSPTISTHEPDAGARSRALCAGNASRWMPNSDATAGSETGHSVDVSPGDGRLERRDHEHADHEQPERPSVCGQPASERDRRRPTAGRFEVRTDPRAAAASEVPAQIAATECRRATARPNAGKNSVTSVEQAAARIATGTAAPAAASTAVTRGGRPDPVPAPRVGRRAPPATGTRSSAASERTAGGGSPGRPPTAASGARGPWRPARSEATGER